MMKKDRAATEKRIYDSFLNLLEERGPQAMGINAIAKNAGVSKELIYRYYGGLEGLLLHFAKKGDFFKSFLTQNDEINSVDDLLQFVKDGTTELRENKIAQEILRWHLLENNDVTKDLFKFTNKELVRIFSVSDKDSSLNHAVLLMIGGYIYFNLISKYNNRFMTMDLSDDKSWEKFDIAIEKTIKIFKK